MITLTGKSVFGGVAIGKISFYKRNQTVIKRAHVEDADAKYPLSGCEGRGVEKLNGLHDKALDDVGEANAMIFEVHQMMLEDLDYMESIENIIRPRT